VTQTDKLARAGLPFSRNVALELHNSRASISAHPRAQQCAQLALSLSSESRRSLCREGGDTFGVILGETQLTLEITLDIELLLERVTPAFIDSPLGERQ